MVMPRQAQPTTKEPHFATLLVMALAPEQVGARIKKARKAKGWTHRQLADAMDVDLRTAQRWQTGKNPKDGKSWLPRLSKLMDLADTLDVPRSYFVETQDSTDDGLREQVESLAQEVEQLRRELRGDDERDGRQGARQSRRR